MRKFNKFVSAACAASLILTGCFWNKEKFEVKREKKQYEEIITVGNKKLNPKAAQERKDTLIVGVNDIKGIVNPLYSTEISDLWASDLAFEGLLSHDEEGKITPNIAEKWDIGDDGKRYSFTLKQGVKFSNGSELTADDVAFTYTALCDPKYNGSYQGHLSMLEGYNDYRHGDADSVAGIQVDSKYQITFFFRESNSSLLYDFEVGILPKSIYNFKKGEVEKFKQPAGESVGAGPYTVSEYKEGTNIKFKKNEYYWKGVPSINNIVIKKTPGEQGLKQLASGDIDMVRSSANIDNVNYLQNLGFADIHLYDNNGYQYIGLNLRNGKFKDKRVRQALMYGLNRDKFIKNYYGEFGSAYNTPFAKVSWAYPQDINEYSYDKAKAESLLNEAGWTKKEDGFRYDKSGKKLTIKWSTYESNKYVEKLIQEVTNDWKSIGVEITVEQLPFQQLVTKIYDNRDFEMYNMSWILTADPDPSSIFSMKEDVPGGNNSVGWRNDESEKLISQAMKETDVNKRKEIYNAWGKLANEELPYLYLNQNKELLAVNMRVQGLNLSPYKQWTDGIYKLKLEAPDQ